MSKYGEGFVISGFICVSLGVFAKVAFHEHDWWLCVSYAVFCLYFLPTAVRSFIKWKDWQWSNKGDLQ